MKGTERRSPKFLLFFFFRFLRLKNYGFDNEAKFISKSFEILSLKFFPLKCILRNSEIECKAHFWT